MLQFWIRDKRKDLTNKRKRLLLELLQSIQLYNILPEDSQYYSTRESQTGSVYLPSTPSQSLLHEQQFDHVQHIAPGSTKRLESSHIHA